MSLLEIKDLEVYYGAINAIKGISFSVEQGETSAVLNDPKVITAYLGE